uniref:AMP-binding_C domain-containing protein n=1 Tax=Mesocestoides corti TaxID=53468 RepID=A0A5K3EFQ3_MESCO
MWRYILQMLMRSPDIEEKVVPELSRHPIIRGIARSLVNLFNISKTKVIKEIKEAPQPSPSLSEFKKQVYSEFKRGLSEK